MSNARTVGILNATVFTHLWISWSQGTIMVGNGHVVGQNGFMSYTDSSASDVNYIALSGWDSPGAVIVNYGECIHFFFSPRHACKLLSLNV